VIGAWIKGTRDRSVRVCDAVTIANAAWIVVIASIGLSLVGVYAIDVATRVDPVEMSVATTTVKQLVFLGVGLTAAFIVALPHYRLIGYFAEPAFIACIGLLIFLLIPFVPESIVTPRNGARGWINLGPADFQPAEVTKIAYVLVVARYLRFRRGHRTFGGLIVPGLITMEPVALITVQPDLGTASLFVPSLFAMLVAAGARLRHLMIIVVCAALAAPATYPLLRPHQKRRFVALVKQIQGDKTTADDINFQSFTAQTLTGAGGAAGTTDEHARALVYYNRLPERHNDMVFAVIVSRFGFLGGLGVIALYLTWIGGALLVSAMCREPFGRLIVVGLTAFIACQMIINIGMTIGIFPIIGVTLPFVSYGGSSLLTVWLMTGLIMNVAMHRARPPYRPSFEYAHDDD